MILLCLRARPVRFGVLRRHLPPVSAKVLAETLQSMERDGFVRRQPAAGIPYRAVEYGLTEFGRSLLPVIDHARQWGRATSANWTGTATATTAPRRAGLPEPPAPASRRCPRLHANRAPHVR